MRAHSGLLATLAAAALVAGCASPAGGTRPAPPAAAVAPDAPGGSGARHRFREIAMGVEVTVVIDSADADSARAAARAAFDAVHAADRALSDWSSSSELAMLTARAQQVPPGTPLPAPAILIEAVEAAAIVSAATDGAFDCTAGPVIALWREARARGTPPDPSAIDAARARVGWRMLRTDAATGTIAFSRHGMRLDFGGIGKGIAAQAAVRAAARAGEPRALVSVAGDIAAGDPPRDRPGWLVAVESGLQGMAPCAVWLSRGALSTSGDAEQALEIAGTRHSHIVDPATGAALTVPIAPTVWCADATYADAAATAASVIGIERVAGMCARLAEAGHPVAMRIAWKASPGGPVQVRTDGTFPACVADAPSPGGRGSAVPPPPSGPAAGR